MGFAGIQNGLMSGSEMVARSAANRIDAVSGQREAEGTVLRVWADAHGSVTKKGHSEEWPFP